MTAPMSWLAANSFSLVQDVVAGLDDSLCVGTVALSRPFAIVGNTERSTALWQGTFSADPLSKPFRLLSA